MIKKIVKVSYLIEVTIDETKFTDEFMEEFEKYMYPADLNDHITNLAALTIELDRTDLSKEYFIEGYGDPKEMGITTQILDEDSHIIDSDDYFYSKGKG